MGYEFNFVAEQGPTSADPRSGASGKPGLFGARKRVRELEAELRTETAQLQQAVAHADRLAAHNMALSTAVADLQKQCAQLRGRDVLDTEQEIQRLRQTVARLEQEATHQRAVQAQRRDGAKAHLASIQRQVDEGAAKLHALRGEIVETEEIRLLQEAGIYEFRHRLADAVAYKAALQKLKDSVKIAAKNNHAITSSTDWTVNGSAVQGQRMVRDFSKLMLRAYNAEADNCVRSMRPYRLESAKDRLAKTREIIARLGKTMNINIAPGYHRLRLEELELTADHLAKVEEEKERVRAERERQRDEQQAQREFEREKAKLAKEEAHWRNALRKWAESGDEQQAEAAQAKLEEIGDAIRGVEEREANIRTGWVYVISNVGSFGDGVVKIGLTRRLDPLERVRELGDASVPFRFDVHAKIFDADAVSLETRLHQHLADRRVNRVNLRREFFYATPHEILAVLDGMGLKDNLVDYVEEPEAPEWRTSRQLAQGDAATSEISSSPAGNNG